jgi:hypothetical protein
LKRHRLNAINIKGILTGALKDGFMLFLRNSRNQLSGSTVGQATVSYSIKGNVKRYISPLELKASNK